MAGFASGVLVLLQLLYYTFIYPFIKCLIGIFKRKKRPDYSRDIVLITGAAQGIGKQIALQFAEHGGTVVLWDIDKDELQETCSQITSQGYEAFAYVVDCSKKDEIYQTAEQVKEDVGNVSVLVNNVGIVNCKSILNLKDEEIIRTVDINFLAHYWTVRSFLPWMMDNNHGHIVAISSAAALGALPALSAYNTTKSAVWNLCETLRAELTVGQKPGVSVTCICPGPIKTKMVDQLKNTIIEDMKYILPPLNLSYSVERMFDAIAEKRDMIIFPLSLYISAILKLVLPEKAGRLLKRIELNLLFNISKYTESFQSYSATTKDHDN